MVVLDPESRVLLIDGSDPGRPHLGRWWEIPGGGVDHGEDTAEAALRELEEEAGLGGVEMGPCVWTQYVEYTFGPFHFEQDEWIHVARWDGETRRRTGLEPLEAAAFGGSRWWTLDEAVDRQLRTIPYRMLEFLEDVVHGRLPETPHDITPDPDHIARWEAQR